MVLMDHCWNLSGRADYRISPDYRSFSSTKAPTQMPMVSVVQATLVKGSNLRTRRTKRSLDLQDIIMFYPRMEALCSLQKKRSEYRRR